MFVNSCRYFVFLLSLLYIVLCKCTVVVESLNCSLVSPPLATFYKKLVTWSGPRQLNQAKTGVILLPLEQATFTAVNQSRLIHVSRRCSSSGPSGVLSRHLQRALLCRLSLGETGEVTIAPLSGSSEMQRETISTTGAINVIVSSTLCVFLFLLLNLTVSVCA